ncbi:MAG: PASTA domain-containing protein [Bacteroidales bacterium]|jgi:beta-lactam-binding protein with PASTA domain|nr:PASTA domain-containing protein [Bacteroidales bacterium]
MAQHSKIKIILINIAALLLICIVAVFIFKGWLSSYTNHGESIEVPDFSNLSMEKAQELAKQKGITLIAFDTVFDETKKGNVIVATKPSAGGFVKEGRTIYATVNSASPLMVQLPKLVDMSLRQAQINIESAGLMVGTIDYVPGIAKDFVKEAKFKNKSVLAGTKIPKRSKIDLVVEQGNGSLGQDYIVPNLIGTSYRDASLKISGLGASVEAIFDSRYTYKISEDSLNAIVWKQSPDADSLSSSSTITIYLMKE